MGDPAVGKSALTQMFHSNGQRFPKVYNMTCGVDFSAKAVKIPDTEEAVELHIFDTGGQVHSYSFNVTLCGILLRVLTARACAPHRNQDVFAEVFGYDNDE